MATAMIADLNGRPLGTRALEKRRRILEATRELLSQTRLRDLRVADIARAVDTSPATFYQYFADVEDVVLELAREANAELPPLLELFDGHWRGADGRERARAVVEFFMQFWDRHGPILRIRNLAADEGDERFMNLRGAAMRPVIAAMTTLMERNGAAGRKADIEPHSAALAMSCILDRTAAYHREMEDDGVSQEDLVTTNAGILLRTLTGK